MWYRSYPTEWLRYHIWNSPLPPNMIIPTSPNHHPCHIARYPTTDNWNNTTNFAVKRVK